MPPQRHPSGVNPTRAIAHLASHEAWVDQSGAPFHETLHRATGIVTAVIESQISFTTTCLDGILTCRP
ncbi:hypothetical protein [Kitasatospora sp. NPDC101183]|uniref:hypothetical protein n=1 Tax=Kitasatospora sp. NPDC101183 TaxID=3364100 RepID=UPI00381CC7CC